MSDRDRPNLGHVYNKTVEVEFGEGYRLDDFSTSPQRTFVPAVQVRVGAANMIYVVSLEVEDARRLKDLLDAALKEDTPQ
jgi:hypothetical protein